jgi:hypothetical protein
MHTGGCQPLDGRENLRTLWSYHHPLGVTCQACGHGALISLKTLNAHDGNTKPLTSPRLVCKQCKARDFEMTIFASQAEVDD